MEKQVSFECVKEITKVLKQKFKGIQANSYGFCCRSDYNANHKHINENDYVCALIFKGGLNNQYVWDKWLEQSTWQLYSSVWFMWGLKEFKLANVVNAMQEVAIKYGCMVVIPEDESTCIELKVVGA